MAGRGFAGLRSHPNNRSSNPFSSAEAEAGRAAGACTAGRIGADSDHSADIGAGCAGVMPFTSGSGRAGRSSGAWVGNPTGSSAGTVTIS